VQEIYPNSIRQYLQNNESIKFAYLFGSYANSMEGPLSDIDLAVYVDKRLDFFSIRLRLLDELSRLLKDHPFDLIILNTAPLTLQYEIIRQGIVLKENKNRRVPFETAVLRRYLDTEPIRLLHMQKLKQSFAKERERGQ